MPLIKRGDVFHWRKTINGQILSKSTKTSDRKLAEQMAAKWEAESLKEIIVDGTKPVTVYQAIDAFLKSRKGTGGYSNACVHTKWWYKLPDVSLKQITIAQLQSIIEMRRDENTAHNTLAVTVAYWNAIVNFCVENGWTGGVKMPSMRSQRTRLRFLTHAEEVRLLEAINPPTPYRNKCEAYDNARQANADLVVALLHTGARYSEVAHMTWDQVDFEKRTVFIRRKKGGLDTLLAMSNKLYEVLSRRREAVEGAHVFPSKLNNSNSYVWLDKALKQANISDEGGKITIHHLRHTYASRMLQAGMSIVEVQQLLGHRNLASTAVYMHVQKSVVASRAAEYLNKM
jgi:integrase